jgi:hypothetical protein
MRANTRLQYFQHFGYKAESVPPSMIASYSSLLAGSLDLQVQSTYAQNYLRAQILTLQYTAESIGLGAQIRKFARVGDTFEPVEDTNWQSKTGRTTTRPFLVADLTDTLANEGTA